MKTHRNGLEPEELMQIKSNWRLSLAEYGFTNPLQQRKLDKSPRRGFLSHVSGDPHP